MNSSVSRRDLPGFPGYAVCDSGQIVSKRSGRALKACFKSANSRVLQVTIRTTTISVAAEVAAAFLDARPDGHILRYIDGNPMNCAASNLEWVPTQESIAEALNMTPRALRRRLFGN